MITLPSATRNIGKQLSQQHVVGKTRNRNFLHSIKFLSRQGLDLRRHGDDSDGNLVQLLRMKAESDHNLATWLEKKDNTYLSPDIQNEIIQVMGLSLLRKLAAKFHNSPLLTAMADETRDASNTEQVALVIRRVTECFEVHEEFVGLYQVLCTDAETLTAVISDVLARLNLSFKKLRGQCYDGASTMSGIKSGVAERIRRLEPRALFTHCYGHSLNLAASDMIKQVKLLKDSLGVTHEITKLIKYSPRCEGIFQRLKENLPSSSSTGIRVLCPTRWTVKADSLASIIHKYEVRATQHVAGIFRNRS